MSSIFGNTNTGGGGGGLFGSSTQQNTSGGGLFGSNTNQQSNTLAGGGLFGSGNNQTSGTTGGGGLFGSTNNQTSNTGGGGLFGSTSNTSGGGLFGSNAQSNTNTGGGGLFGSNAQSNTNTVGGGLFGNTNQNQTQTNNNAGSSLFGGSTTQQQQQSQQQQGSSLFGGAGQIQQQQALKASSFNPQTVTVGNLGHTMTHAQLQRLQFSGASTVPNEKSITKQIQTVKEKWNPALPRQLDPNAPNNIPTTILKTYFYNAAAKEYAPFFYPDESRGEDERSWEEALSQRPELPKIDGQEVTTLTYVPVLCVGFQALGQRVETQAKIIEEMRIRLHEMNNSLSAVMAAHQQRITVKINNVKKQHEVLSQRCLRLAVKVQVLRNRGYALDPQEEGLRRTLLDLEKQVTDPGFIGREDESWARMVALRERARWLEEEGKRVAGQIQDQSRNAGKQGGVSEEVLAKTRKILKDYDGQLRHLTKEMENVKMEYAAWEETQSSR
ncbi:hypothetical protein AC579_9190 [Pseudocercospora musae]|uniref:Nucleoporin Nup54 alpha-helical domain-containing protein n=1 Tax=Pseudocercospora musae TaxID=113226 RepID=A0A139HAU6_9PEZI|nr:hypothetical protein AC579_9190 [Pseudocercospora musae]